MADKIADPLQQLLSTNGVVGVSVSEKLLNLISSASRLAKGMGSKNYGLFHLLFLFIHSAAHNTSLLIPCNWNILYWICFGTFRLPR